LIYLHLCVMGYATRFPVVPRPECVQAVERFPLLSIHKIYLQIF
jgi:hypothetical protein